MVKVCQKGKPSQMKTTKPCFIKDLNKAPWLLKYIQFKQSFQDSFQNEHALSNNELSFINLANARIKAGVTISAGCRVTRELSKLIFFPLFFLYFV